MNMIAYTSEMGDQLVGCQICFEMGIASEMHHEIEIAHYPLGNREYRGAEYHIYRHISCQVVKELTG